MSWIEVGCSLGPSGTVRGSIRNLKLYALIWNQPDHNFVISGDEIRFWCCVLILNNFFSFHFFHFPFYFCRNQSDCMPGISKNLIVSHFEIFAFFGGSFSKNLSEFFCKKFSPGKINWALAFAPEGRIANGNA